MVWVEASQPEAPGEPGRGVCCTHRAGTYSWDLWLGPIAGYYHREALLPPWAQVGLQREKQDFSTVTAVLLLLGPENVLWLRAP